MFRESSLIKIFGKLITEWLTRLYENGTYWLVECYTSGATIILADPPETKHCHY